MNYIIPFLILIMIVVFIHEYGHYYFAKRYGVGVTDFSIGFGREIFGWNDKSGTRWKVCWIPLGGYVKFFGDRNVFSQTEQQEIINKQSDMVNNKINLSNLQKSKLISKKYKKLKLLGSGDLKNKLNVEVNWISKSAKEKVEKLGGKVTLINKTE